jgi:hypothetical protein
MKPPAEVILIVGQGSGTKKRTLGGEDARTEPVLDRNNASVPVGRPDQISASNSYSGTRQHFCGFKNGRCD